MHWPRRWHRAAILACTRMPAARYRAGAAIKLARMSSGVHHLARHPGAVDHSLHPHRTQFAVDLGHRTAAAGRAHRLRAGRAASRPVRQPRHAPRGARRAQGARSGAGSATLRGRGAPDRRRRQSPALRRRTGAPGTRARGDRDLSPGAERPVRAGSQSAARTGAGAVRQRGVRGGARHARRADRAQSAISARPMATCCMPGRSRAKAISTRRSRSMRAVSKYYAGAEAPLRYAQLLRTTGKPERRAACSRNCWNTRALAPRHYRKMQQQWLSERRARAGRALSVAHQSLTCVARAAARLLLGDAMDVAAAEQDLARRHADDAPPREHAAQHPPRRAVGARVEQRQDHARHWQDRNSRSCRPAAARPAARGCRGSATTPARLAPRHVQRPRRGQLVHPQPPAARIARRHAAAPRRPAKRGAADRADRRTRSGRPPRARKAGQVVDVPGGLVIDHALAQPDDAARAQVAFQQRFDLRRGSRTDCGCG